MHNSSKYKLCCCKPKIVFYIFSLSLNRTLNSHIEINHNKTFKVFCDLCQKNFVKRSNLSAHTKNLLKSSYFDCLWLTVQKSGLMLHR